MTEPQDPSVVDGTPPPDVSIDVPPEPEPTRLGSTAVSELRASHVEVSESAIGRAVAHDVQLHQGAMGFVRGRSVVTRESAVGAVAAERVETHGGFAFLLLARRVSGDVTVLFDWRAVAAGVGALLIVGRLLRVLR